MQTIEEHPSTRGTQATSTVSETERILSKLGHGYKKAKAQQIFRLLKDQESLNQRFRDCALEEDGPLEQHGDNLHYQEDMVQNPPVPTEDKKRVSVLKKVSEVIDPSRCRTSMGFYNEAECSGSLDGNHDSDFEAETDAAVLEEREAMMGRLATGYKYNNPRHRVVRLNLQDDADSIPEESVVQSARSSRPKTGIATSSARSKQYRRPSQTDSMAKCSVNSTVSTSVSKLDGPFTPRGGIRGFCDGQGTPRDELPYTLTPRQNELSLCLSPRKNDACYTPRRDDVTLCITPRGGNTPRGLFRGPNDSLWTPREENIPAGTPRSRNSLVCAPLNSMVGPSVSSSMKNGRLVEKSLFDMNPTLCNETPTRSRRQAGGSTAAKTLALGDRGLSMRMPHTPRAMLSVDQSPLHSIPQAAQDGEVVTPRRAKPEGKPKKRGEMQRMGVHQNLSKLSERVHPIPLMKLPPLETALNKPVLS